MQKKSHLNQLSLDLFDPYIRTLSGATTPGQSEPRSNDNEGVLHIPHSSSITGASPSNCFMSYPGHSLGESYPSAEVQSVNSTAPANCVIICSVQACFKETNETNTLMICYEANMFVSVLWLCLVSMYHRQKGQVLSYRFQMKSVFWVKKKSH